MKKIILSIIMIGLTYALFADIITLKNESVFNGTIIGKQGNVIYIKTKDLLETKFFAIDQGTIAQIIDDDIQLNTNQFFIKKDFSNDINLNNISNLSHIKFRNSLNLNELNNTKYYKNKVNYEYLILGVAFGFLAWDYFAEVSDISDQINYLEEYGTEIDKSKLTKTQSRKFITGLALSASSVFSFIVSFEKVEVKATPNSINMSYKL